MAEEGDIEVQEELMEEYPTTTLDGEEIKLFGKWPLKGVEIKDPGLRRYISLKPVFLPHSEGRHEKRRFAKSKVPIVETDENPIQVLVRAIENSAPREETTRIMYGGILYYVSVDVAPQRRVDLALRFIAEGARLAAFNNPKPIEEALADEIIAAANNDPNSYAVRRKEEIERIALSAR